MCCLNPRSRAHGREPVRDARIKHGRDAGSDKLTGFFGVCIFPHGEVRARAYA